MFLLSLPTHPHCSYLIFPTFLLSSSHPPTLSPSLIISHHFTLLLQPLLFSTPSSHRLFCRPLLPSSSTLFLAPSLLLVYFWSTFLMQHLIFSSYLLFLTCSPPRFYLIFSCTLPPSFYFWFTSLMQLLIFFFSYSVSPHIQPSLLLPYFSVFLPPPLLSDFHPIYTYTLVKFKEGRAS